MLYYRARIVSSLIHYSLQSTPVQQEAVSNHHFTGGLEYLSQGVRMSLEVRSMD
jgi:hypothetical protein